MRLPIQKSKGPWKKGKKTKSNINILVKKPLSILRKMQDNWNDAIKQAYDDKNVEKLRRLRKQYDEITEAIDKKEFGN